jgi:hypothetical protein
MVMVLQAQRNGVASWELLSADFQQKFRPVSGAVKIDQG